MGASTHFTSASNEYLKHASNLGVTAYPITLVVWVKFDTTPNQSALTFADDGANQAYLTIGQRTSLPTMLCSAGTFTPLVGTTTLLTGQWYHIAGVWTSATDRELFLNGVSENTATSSVVFPTGINNASVGRLNRLSPADPTNGDVAYPQIYNRALTVDELHEIMHVPYSVDGLVWAPDLRIEGSVAADFTDLSGLGNEPDSATMPSSSTDGPPVYFPKLGDNNG